MQSSRRTIVGGVIGLLVLYVIGGPILAEAAMPVFQTTVTGSCTTVTTQVGCCGDITEAVGRIWAPVLVLLQYPGLAVERMDQSSIQCMCQPLPTVSSPVVDGDVCRMATRLQPRQVTVRCTADSRLVLENGSPFRYTVTSVQTDGQSTGLVPRNGTTLDSGRLAVGRLDDSTSTVTIELRLAGSDIRGTIKEDIACS